MTQETQALLAEYKVICNNLLRVFCEKQDMPYDPTLWVSSEPGGVIEVADYWLDFTDDILTDLRQEAPKGEILKWYDHALTCHTLGITEQPNYHTWLRGYHGISDEGIERVREARAKVKQAETDLRNLVDDEIRKSIKPQ